MGKASGKRARKVVLGVAAVGVATTVAGGCRHTARAYRTC